MAILNPKSSNSKRDRFFIKINLFDDILKQKLRILAKFAESPAIFNVQVVWVRGSGVEKWSFSNIDILYTNRRGISSWFQKCIVIYPFIQSLTTYMHFHFFRWRTALSQLLQTFIYQALAIFYVKNDPNLLPKFWTPFITSYRWWNLKNMVDLF